MSATVGRAVQCFESHSSAMRTNGIDVQKRQQKRAPRGCSLREFCTALLTFNFAGRYLRGTLVVRHSRTGGAMFRIPFVRNANERHRSAETPTKKSTARVLFFVGAPAGTRIPDTLIKSQVLYRLSYRGVLFRTVLFYHNKNGLSIPFFEKE